MTFLLAVAALLAAPATSPENPPAPDVAAAQDAARAYGKCIGSHTGTQYAAGQTIDAAAEAALATCKVERQAILSAAARLYVVEGKTEAQAAEAAEKAVREGEQGMITDIKAKVTAG